MVSHENFVPNTQSQGKANSVNRGSRQSIPETQNIVIIICVYIEMNYFRNISKFYSQFAIILFNFLMHSFQNMTQDVPHFELGWLGDEEDEWIIVL